MHDLHHSRARGRLHRAHIRHPATLRPQISAAFCAADGPEHQVSASRSAATGDSDKSQDDAAGKARRPVAAELISDLERSCQRKKAAGKGLTALLASAGTTLMELHGMGPSGTARLLVEVGGVTRFPARARFASWNGTAPIDASSGDQVRHRLSRAGNRQINRVLHIMAAGWLRNPTEGRAYYDRKVAAGKTPREAMRALKRRLSDIACHQMTLDARAAGTGPGGHVGAAAGSSAAGLHPSAGTSEKSLPGPATDDLTPEHPLHSSGHTRRPPPAPDRSCRQAQSA